MSPLAALAVPDVRDAYFAQGIDSWSDRRLAAEVAEVVAVPKEAPADSFVLHAPLELLGRVGLLPAVRPDAREGARQRLVWLAAAHGSILLYLLPRVAPGGEVTGAVLRGPARELARMPQWRLHWFEDPDEPIAGSPLADALLDVPPLGVPGSTFIHPIMSQAEDSGLAAKLLSGVLAARPQAAEARRELSRVAAWSMLQEPPDFAPYGWSHCLTMPQAVLGLAGRGTSDRTAVAVAATHVVGFRAALGAVTIHGNWRPPAPATTDLVEAIGAGPLEAAASAWHAAEGDDHAVVTELATRASLHHDAHLVKYTLACLDAAADDPDQRRLYLAAAASLSAWWAAQPD